MQRTTRAHPHDGQPRHRDRSRSPGRRPGAEARVPPPRRHPAADRGDARWDTGRHTADERDAARHGYHPQDAHRHRPPPPMGDHAYAQGGLPYDDYSAHHQRDMGSYAYNNVHGGYSDPSTAGNGTVGGERDWNAPYLPHAHAGAAREDQEPSEPSRDVIFLGLETTYSEEPMLEFLRTKCQAAVDKCTIVRDRSTGASRGFGFASFSSYEAAERFVNAFFPNIAIPSVYPNNPAMNVKIDYAGTGAQGQATQGRQGWQDPRAAVLGGNEGMRDIAPAGEGNRVLLMRGLAPDSMHEEIRDRIGAEIVRLAASASADADSAAPAGPITDGRPAISKVILIRNKHTKLCAGFGFIELVSNPLATALLAHLLSRTAQPVGFVINGRPVACSFANMKAFAAVGPEGVSEAWCIPCAPSVRPGGIGGESVREGGWVKYWDDTCGASLLDVSSDQDQAQGSGSRDQALDRFLEGLDVAADPGQGKDQLHVAAASAPGSGPGTPLASGAVGAIKMLPLKVGKKKEVDAMVALPVAGLEKSGSNGAFLRLR
ncbi:hypothetical protein QFC19_003691 [Naganishia cerealis]|uniref:Uncharacterized protein n=1 Tax=Naganishia cerealis TaxID=610337 RepID=A0ACC2W1G2_9TREE|nr:hypothetical protein QFC19_003691 [Naganishia cerealis]